MLFDSDEERLKQIKDRFDKLSRGSWSALNAGNAELEDGTLVPLGEVRGLPRPWNPVWVGWTSVKNHFKTFMRIEDAEFVAYSRLDIPFLLELLEKRDKEIESLQQAQISSFIRETVVLLPAIPGHRHEINEAGEPTCGCKYDFSALKCSYCGQANYQPNPRCPNHVKK